MKYIFSKYLPQINIILAFRNNYRISSFFKIKEQLPVSLCSSTVYLFTCSKCSLEYVGSSIKNLTLRVDEHRAVSSRTHLPLVRPLNSSIRLHCHEQCNIQFSIKDFKILTTAGNNEELRIAESIYIKLRKPSLNRDSASFPLHIF